MINGKEVLDIGIENIFNVGLKRKRKSRFKDRVFK